MTTLSDNYNRADSGSLGPQYTLVDGSIDVGVSGNRGSVTADSGCFVRFNGAALGPDQEASAKVWLNGSAGNGFVLAVRYDAAAARFYGLEIYGTGVWVLYRYVIGGGETVLASGSVSLTNGDTITLSAAGSTITAKHSGTQIASVSDATWPTGAQAGFGVWGAGANQAQWDDWIVTDGEAQAGGGEGAPELSGAAVEYISPTSVVPKCFLTFEDEEEEDDPALTLAVMQGDVNTSLPHEMLMDGVNPAWSWGSHGRPGVGANPPSASGWGSPAWVAWGHAATERNNAPGSHNWRLATLEIHTHERRNGQWQAVHAHVTTPAQHSGAMYLDYETNENVAPDRRSSAGFHEVKFPNAGGSYHWYTSFRTAIPSGGCQHRVALIRAALTLDNPGGLDDRAAARVAVLVGGDYWRSMSTQWNDAGYTNDDFWIGRARKPALWPKTSWHVAHTMTSEADINGYLAWLEAQGILG